MNKLSFVVNIGVGTEVHRYWYVCACAAFVRCKGKGGLRKWLNFAK